MVVPALWVPMRCNWHQHTGATSLPRQAVTMRPYVKSIGAGRVINYREAQFEKVLGEKVDVVFDLVGWDSQKRSFLVFEGGRRPSRLCHPARIAEEATRNRVSGEMMRLAPSEDMLEQIARLLEQGTIRPDVAESVRAPGYWPGLRRISPETADRAVSEGKPPPSCRSELCEAWQWRQANGALRDMVCRACCLMLERAGRSHCRRSVTCGIIRCRREPGRNLC